MFLRNIEVFRPNLPTPGVFNVRKIKYTTYYVNIIVSILKEKISTPHLHSVSQQKLFTQMHQPNSNSEDNKKCGVFTNYKWNFEEYYSFLLLIYPQT